MKVLQLEVLIAFDGSLQENHDARLRWERRGDVAQGGFQAGLQEILESEEGHIPVCRLLKKLPHRMYITSEGSIVDQIKEIAYMSLITKSGENIREANLMKDCLKQIEMESLLSTEMTSKLSNAFSTRKSFKEPVL